ncbi:MAG: hypothetical protein CMJ58_11545 [Planctomycetaceae bacterium]|nr:hypothetical protein [Planctomycetaceae bacterium]
MSCDLFSVGVRAGVAALVALFVSTCAAVEGPEDFRAGWKFAQGDPGGAAAVDFDDSAWTSLRLPHDWAIAGPFDETERSGHAAKLPWKGVGWYRKHVALDLQPGERVYLDFDGVMAFPQVYVNGQLAGTWDYGYTSFSIDATPFVKRQGENVVAVRVDTTRHGTRWYPGAGIYRKVALRIERDTHLQHWGVVVTTPEVTAQRAAVHVDATVERFDHKERRGAVEFTILDPAGAQVAQRRVDAEFDTGETTVSADFEIANPKLWDIGDGQLYTLRTKVLVDGEAVDSGEETFGLRWFELTADDGFHLNGRRVQLYGVNLHHDQGPLGAAFYPRAMERQLEIMREMGVNAIRTSHNAPAPELLDLCDRMGLFVWDECFDKWDKTADRSGPDAPSYRDHGERHLGSMVRRDRNHPSVFVWSIGNEIPGSQGARPDRMQMYADIVRKHDPTRPVGIGCHIPSQVREGMFEGVDFTGWNYARRYADYHERYPDRPIIYSESASALSTRGFYELPLPTGKTDYANEALQVDSYDFNAAPWSDIADREFALMQRDPFVAGEFVWTGFDYLGEPTPFTAEARSSYFGIVDLCGIPKDRYWLYRSYWRPEETTVHILPHWNWPDRVGQSVPVMVYTNGDEAELFLNGKSQGRRRKGERPEQPENLAASGTLSATSSQAGRPTDDAIDGDPQSRWCASDARPFQTFAVDLGSEQTIKFISIEFEQAARNYGFVVEVSSDGMNWDAVAEQEAGWGIANYAPQNRQFDVDARGRYVRIRFNDLAEGTWASIYELGVYPARAESDYYDPIYDYRLRWSDVTYEPGELRVVAYKDGAKIGEATRRTAGPPAQLRLTPDRTELAATGDDLCYLLVEALDAQGNLCPLADDTVNFDVSGPAEIAAVGNGNPISYEPFVAETRKLFFGKALLILRTKPGAGGEVTVQASSDGLKSATVTLNSTP